MSDQEIAEWLTYLCKTPFFCFKPLGPGQIIQTLLSLNANQSAFMTRYIKRVESLVPD